MRHGEKGRDGLRRGRGQEGMYEWKEEGRERRDTEEKGKDGLRGRRDQEGVYEWKEGGREERQGEGREGGERGRREGGREETEKGGREGREGEGREGRRNGSNRITGGITLKRSQTINWNTSRSEVIALVL